LPARPQCATAKISTSVDDGSDRAVEFFFPPTCIKKTLSSPPQSTVSIFNPYHQSPRNRHRLQRALFFSSYIPHSQLLLLFLCIIIRYSTQDDASKICPRCKFMINTSCEFYVCAQPLLTWLPSTAAESFPSGSPRWQGTFLCPFRVDQGQGHGYRYRSW
jgi:hypothetical protein